MKPLTIYSWNVNGIRSVWNKGNLQNFITTHQPDILCLQETKAHKDQSEVDLPQYEEYWCSAEKKGYSGTAIFTKQTPIKVTAGLPPTITNRFTLHDQYGDTTTEGRIITAEFKDFYILSIYVPNAKDDLSRIPMRLAWDPAILTYLKELQMIKPVIIGGDFNVAHQEIDLARPKENRGKKGFTDEERSGMTAFHENGFIDTFRTLHPTATEHYTWWSHWGNARMRNIGWRIDYILMSTTLVSRLKKAEIHPDIIGSDHCPVSITLL